MGYRSSRGSGHGFQSSLHSKPKTKKQKHKDKNKLAPETTEVTVAQTTEKTLNSLTRLGEQKFAVSPFSQYFDDWLINLKEVLFEFESNKSIEIDEIYAKEREKIVQNVEDKFAELKQAESALSLKVKELADSNHKLVDLDADYAAKTRELGPKRNAEIENLTLKVKEIEEELDRIKKMKTSLFRFTKKAKAKIEAEAVQKLGTAKSELLEVVEKFKVEQEKLHDQYEKEKQAFMKRVQELEKEVAKLETDTSSDTRRETNEALVKAINDMFQRNPAFAA